MGIVRKTLSVSTLGLVRFRTNTERRASARVQEGRAAKRESKARAALLEAQTREVEARTRRLEG